MGSVFVRVLVTAVRRVGCQVGLGSRVVDCHCSEGANLTCSD